jgi:hypothetical protein
MNSHCWSAYSSKAPFAGRTAALESLTSLVSCFPSLPEFVLHHW